MDGAAEAFTAWAKLHEGLRDARFDEYVHSIAQARFVIRKVVRIVDEQSRAAGLEPLQHQALLQVLGLEAERPSINRLAARLDIAPAFASRLVRTLEHRGYVRRTSSTDDRRVVTVEATEAGVAIVKDIDRAVHSRVEFFRRAVSDVDRDAALAIFAFYVGLAPSG
jgi:DNA-binding MarR family transcriptional regulator